MKNITTLSSRLFTSVKTLILIASLGFAGAASAQHASNTTRIEKENQRDLFAKHFQNADGSIEAVISAGPVHYEKSGSFHNINTAIGAGVIADFPYANLENLMQSHFGATAHKGIVNVINNVAFAEFTNTKMFWEVNGAIQNVIASQNVAATVVGNKATYANMYPSISAEFKVENGKRKLNYIIPSADALAGAPAGATNLVFAEDITLPNKWTAVTKSNGIFILDEKGEAVALYNNPHSSDATNKVGRGTNTKFEVVTNGNVVTVLTKVATNWLLDAARQFPIMVDPTVTASPDNTANMTGSVYSDGSRIDDVVAFGRDEDYLGLPDFVRGFAKFNTASIPDNSIISTGSVIKFYVYGGSEDYSPDNGHKLVFSQIPTSVNTDNNTIPNNAVIFNTINQNGYTPYMTSAINSIGFKTHTITSAILAADIQAQLATDKIVLGFMPDGDFYAEEYIMTYGHSNANRPTLTITYTEPDMSIADNTKLIGLYPNPAQDQLNITTDATVTAIEVFSLLGQSVAKNVNSNQISVAGLANGMYAVQVTLDNGTVVNQKFMKN